MPRRSMVQQGIVIIFLGVAAGAVHSALRPLDAPRAALPSGDAGTPTASDPGGLVHGQEIDLAKAWELFQAGTPFADARFLEDYEKGHVEGAFWITTDQFMNGKVPAALDFLDKSSWIVIYCTGGNCDASHNVAEFLRLVGFGKCLIMKDGYQPWAEAGHPTAIGKPEIGAP
ncbi:MAG: hypothetical protein HBSAPP03_03790 [Phycisphaerae bacterium]|nr:MAG: hypothetical protein HBSAPP03_03790 [Phycisphaerae bacterium]